MRADPFHGVEFPRRESAHFVTAERDGFSHLRAMGILTRRSKLNAA